MTEKLNIVQSTTEPDKRNIWLKDNELKKFGAKGWSTIGGSNTGGGNGGTSTDKDALYIYFDWDTHNIVFNNKVFTTEYSTSSGYHHVTIRNKELYNTLYNSLVDTNTLIYIKTLSTNKVQIFGNFSYYADGEDSIEFTTIIELVIFNISIMNR